MPAATRTKPKPPAQMTVKEIKAAVAGMTAEQILAELAEIASPLDYHEAEAKRLIDRRFVLWLAARLLPKDQRPIFLALARESNRSEALVIRHTGKWFKQHGIDPRTFDD
jgi:hypothetical protein